MAIHTEQVLHMNGGVGETSYANNSSLQKKAMMKAKPILEESIKKMFHSTTVSSCLKIADLGCSSGPNALMAASNIIDIVTDEASCRFNDNNNNETPINFQIFLNDLFGNDFNTLFKSVQELYHTLKEKKMKKEEKNNLTCFINATPGSFYGRLFPSDSIHFFHSSYTLHWLSQVPKVPVDNNRANNVYVRSIYTPSYVEQFKHDFKLFLRSRSEELVPGGAMLLTLMGRYDTSQLITSAGMFRQVLMDMVFENMIEETKLECIRLPIYQPRAEEVREIIEEEGSFKVERLEGLRTSWDGSSLDEDGNDNQCFVDVTDRGKFIAKYIRAAFEPLLKARLEESLMDELFLRFENKAVQFMDQLEYPTLVISLFKIA